VLSENQTSEGIHYLFFDVLGTLRAKIYNIDTKFYDVQKWSELANVRYFFDFFQKHIDEF